MTDENFPGFEDEEPAKAPAKPAAAKAPAKPETGRIAAEGAAPPALKGASGPVAFEFEDSGPAKPKKAYVPPPAESAPTPAPPSGKGAGPAKAGAIDRSPPPPSQKALDEADADLKPGSRKDLWACPHCGTGNRPNRDTCRICGKRPDEAVVVPVYKRPVVVAAAVIGVVAVLALLFLVTGHVDMTLKPADAAVIDRAPRIFGKGESHTLTSVAGAPAFTGAKRISVDGRIIGVSPSAAVVGGWTVVLLLGAAGADPGAAAASKVDFTGDQASVTASGTYTVLHLLPAGPVTAYKPKSGAMLSLDGDTGDLDGLSNGSGEYTVWVEHLDQQ